MKTILFLLPPETWILLLVLAGFLMIFGFRKLAGGIIGTVILLALLSPFIDALVECLPTWLLIILTFFSMMSLIRLIIGKGAADHVMGHLIYDLILAPFRFIGWILRGSGRRP